MWGGTNSKLNITTQMRNEMIKRGNNWIRGYDQDLLVDIVWKRAKMDSVQHDSYRCIKYNHSIPWPTKRIGKLIVGQPFPWEDKHVELPICPKACRPVHHQDWIHC